MDKIIDWLKKHRVLSIGLGFIAPLIVVHILFLIPAPVPFLSAQWGAGDVIAYCAGFMAFSGTVFLGITANKQNSELMEWQKAEASRSQSCSIFLHDGPLAPSMDDKIFLDNESKPAYTGDTIHCEMRLCNTSPVFLNEMRFYNDTYEFLCHITLMQGTEKLIGIDIPNTLESYTIEFISCHGVKTYGAFTIDKGFDNETDWSHDREITNTPYIKHYHFYGTKPPKQEDTTDANT